MWTRKLYKNGGQKCVGFPKELMDNLQWNYGDQMLITLSGRNIITLTRVEAERVPEHILRAASELPNIAYGR